MIRYENECVGCPSEFGCSWSYCPYSNVKRYYCDKCMEEATLYYYDGLEICANCLLKEFEVVLGSDEYY